MLLNIATPQSQLLTSKSVRGVRLQHSMVAVLQLQLPVKLPLPHLDRCVTVMSSMVCSLTVGFLNDSALTLAYVVQRPVLLLQDVQ